MTIYTTSVEFRIQATLEHTQKERSKEEMTKLQMRRKQNRHGKRQKAHILKNII